MTLALMLGMGAYAMQAASTEIRTSGYVRQSTQTHYLTEYGILGAAAHVQGATAGTYQRLMKDPDYRDNLPSSTTRNVAAGRVGAKCPSLTYVPANASDLSLACKLIGSGELAQQWRPLDNSAGTTRTALVPYDATKPLVPGSLGAAPITGDFAIELTDPRDHPPPAGYDVTSSIRFVSFTVTATGVTMPALASTQSVAIYSGQTVETARARITAGPL
jgi:hypothetical protein